MEAPLQIKRQKVEDEPQKSTAPPAKLEIPPSQGEELKGAALPLEEKKPPQLSYDLEWLAITKVTDRMMSLKTFVDYSDILKVDPNYRKYVGLRGKPIKWDITFSELIAKKNSEIASLKTKIKDQVEVFPMGVKKSESEHNPQTISFLSLLELESKLYPVMKEPQKTTQASEEIDVIEFC